MSKRVRTRRPHVRISKSGKVSLSGGHVRIGSRRSGINLSKSGISSTIGGPGGMSYNTRRGCRLPFFSLLLLSLLAFVALRAIPTDNTN